VVDRPRHRKPGRVEIRGRQIASSDQVRGVCRNCQNVGFGIAADPAGSRLVRDQPAIRVRDGDRELAAPEIDSELKADRNPLEELRMSAAGRSVTHATHAHVQTSRYQKLRGIDDLESTLLVREGGSEMRLAVAALLGFGWFATLGCAGSMFDFTGNEKALEEAQSRYTELMRWGEIEGASAFVDPALATEFLVTAERFKHIRFTEFKSGPLRFGEDSKTATVNVVYHTYSIATVNVVYHTYSIKTFVEKKFREHQQWYREESAGNSWRVRSDLAAIASELSDSR